MKCSMPRKRHQPRRLTVTPTAPECWRDIISCRPLTTHFAGRDAKMAMSTRYAAVMPSYRASRYTCHKASHFAIWRRKRREHDAIATRGANASARRALFTCRLAAVGMHRRHTARRTPFLLTPSGYYSRGGRCCDEYQPPLMHFPNFTAPAHDFSHAHVNVRTCLISDARPHDLSIPTPRRFYQPVNNRVTSSLSARLLIGQSKVTVFSDDIEPSRPAAARLMLRHRIASLFSARQFAEHAAAQSRCR